MDVCVTKGVAYWRVPEIKRNFISESGQCMAVKQKKGDVRWMAERNRVNS